MNKREFLTTLEKRLDGISAEDRIAALSYYERIIDEYTVGGCTEEAAVSRLAYVDYIAEEILEDPTLPRRKKDVHSNRQSMYAQPKRKPMRKLRWWELLLLILTFPAWSIAAVAGAVLFVSFFVLCFLTVIAVYTVDFALAAIAIASLLASPIPALFRTSISGLLLLLGIAFVCGGLSILLFRVANRLAIRLLRFCKYLLYRSIAKFRERRVVT